MAFLLKIDTLSNETKTQIFKRMRYSWFDKIKNTKNTIYYPLVHDKKNNTINIPLGLMKDVGIKHDLICIENKSSNVELRREQDLFLTRQIEKLNEFTSLGWEIEPGFGKTIVTIDLVQRLGMKSIVLVPRKFLLDQWKREIDKYLVTKSLIDVYMIGNVDFAAGYEVVIIDEVHLSLTKLVWPKLAKIYPKILIGLSATFYKYNEQDFYLKLFFGQEISKLSRCEMEIYNTSKSRILNLYPIFSKIKPCIKFGYNNKLDWNTILKSLSENESRNLLIANIVGKNLDKNILILVKFVEHGRVLKKICNDEYCSKLNIFSCFGNERLSDDDVDKLNLLISTFKKMGTGISIKKMNCLILAMDVCNYSIQYIGRVMRDSAQDVYVYDIVDDFPSLLKHYKQRCEIYKELGFIF